VRLVVLGLEHLPVHARPVGGEVLHHHLMDVHVQRLPATVHRPKEHEVRLVASALAVDGRTSRSEVVVSENVYFLPLGNAVPVPLITSRVSKRKYPSRFGPMTRVETFWVPLITTRSPLHVVKATVVIGAERSGAGTWPPSVHRSGC
jgi:hypothetical protein